MKSIIIERKIINPPFMQNLIYTPLNFNKNSTNNSNLMSTFSSQTKNLYSTPKKLNYTTNISPKQSQFSNNGKNIEANE